MENLFITESIFYSITLSIPKMSSKSFKQIRYYNDAKIASIRYTAIYFFRQVELVNKFYSFT